MHPPPGNGATSDAGHVGGRERQRTDATEIVCETAPPVNVARLTALSVAFRHRPATRDIVARCFCGGKLIIDAERPFHFCLGPSTCPANRMSFQGVIVRLRGEVAT